jgi:hypothetical protein
MSILAVMIQVEAWLFLGAVTAIVLHRLVSGGINLGTAQLNRAQLLLAVIAVAAYYLAAVVASPGVAMLPSLPGAVIAALGGSNILHLANLLAERWPAIARSGKSP